jgi:hypothetical protein
LIVFRLVVAALFLVVVALRNSCGFVSQLELGLLFTAGASLHRARKKLTLHLSGRNIFYSNSADVEEEGSPNKGFMIF